MSRSRAGFAAGTLQLHGMYFHVGEAQAYLLTEGESSGTGPDEVFARVAPGPEPGPEPSWDPSRGPGPELTAELAPEPSPQPCGSPVRAAHAVPGTAVDA